MALKFLILFGILIPNLFAQINLSHYPDLILTNGVIYSDTSTPDQTSYKLEQAISIRDGLILSIGSRKDIETFAGPKTTVIDLQGKFVYPGFIDASNRFIEGGLSLNRLNLSEIRNIDELKLKTKSYVLNNPMKRWILGYNWNPNEMQTLPTKSDLDSIISDRPVMIISRTKSQIILNSKAIEALKAENPSGSGNYSDPKASEYIAKIDRPNQEDIRQAILNFQTEALKYGITSIHGDLPADMLEDSIMALNDLYKTKQLKVRVALFGNLNEIEKFQKLKEKYKNLPEEWIELFGLKLKIDGEIEGHTALLFDTYSDNPNLKIENTITQEKLNDLVIKANHAGFSVSLQTSGDKAVGMALAAFSTAKKRLFNDRYRNRVEGVELLTTAMYPRFRELRTAVSTHPMEMGFDSKEQNFFTKFIGKERAKLIYPYRSILKANSHLLFGSNWPSRFMNPLQGIQMSVLRKCNNPKLNCDLNLDETITIDQAFYAYSFEGAFATHEDHLKGSIKEGKFADLVILERNPFKEKQEDLSIIPVSFTISNGQIVYQR